MDKIGYTSKFLYTLSIIFFMVALSIITLKFWILYSVYPFLILIFYSWYYIAFKDTNFTIEREIDKRRYIEGETTTIKLKIHSDKKNLLKIWERYNNVLKIFTFYVKNEKICEYKINIKRDIYIFQDIIAEIKDPFSFFYKRKKFKTMDYILGLPKIEDIRLKMNVKGYKVISGVFPSPRSGESTEFHAIRNYVPGDPFKIINWKSTARFGKLMSNEYESEKKVDFILVLDTPIEGKRAVDYVIRAAVSVLYYALKEGIPFGVLICSDVGYYLKPDYGRTHFFKAVDFLCKAEAKKRMNIVGQVDNYGRRFFPPRAKVIFISPMIDDKALDAVRVLRSYRYEVLVITPSLFSIEYTGLEKTKENEIAYKVLEMERKNILTELKRYAKIVDWKTEIPLRTALEEIL
ncbi:MAG: DUF58 domain-containing protein [Methanomicrobia archaeon]|nr:DUF58 domain-containing protein [Methanomicrobia archaeon]